MQGVNNVAHLGGFIGGWVASQLLVSGVNKGDGRLTILFALALLIVTAAGIFLSFYNNWHLLLIG